MHAHVPLQSCRLRCANLLQHPPAGPPGVPAATPPPHAGSTFVLAVPTSPLALSPPPLPYHAPSARQRKTDSGALPWAAAAITPGSALRNRPWSHSMGAIPQRRVSGEGHPSHRHHARVGRATLSRRHKPLPQRTHERRRQATIPRVAVTYCCSDVQSALGRAWLGIRDKAPCPSRVSSRRLTASACAACSVAARGSVARGGVARGGVTRGARPLPPVCYAGSSCSKVTWEGNARACLASRHPYIPSSFSLWTTPLSGGPIMRHNTSSSCVGSRRHSEGKKVPLPHNPAQAYGTVPCCAGPPGDFPPALDDAACRHVAVCGGSSKGIARIAPHCTHADTRMSAPLSAHTTTSSRLPTDVTHRL